MYKIEAIVRPHLVEAIRESLKEEGISGLTVMDVRGSGKQAEVTHQFRGSQYGSHLGARVLLIVAVTDSELDAAVNLIQAAATTGEVGDGKIFVTKLHDVVRIRTNERGTLALS